MAAGRFVVPPYFPARNRDFDLLSGAKLYVYDNLTTDKANIYTDEALTVLSANPVIANSSGQFPAIWAQAGTEAEPVLYSVSVTTSTGASPGNPFNFDNYRPSVDWETAAAALAEAAAALAVAEASAAAVSADEAAADAVLTAADLAAIEAIIADAPDAPSVLNKLNRNGDNASAGLLAAIGEQTPSLTAITAPVVDSDILTGYRSGLRRFTASVFADYIKAFFSASGGSALVGWLSSATGAVLRTVSDRLNDVVSVKDFGATGNGSTDDSAALNLALASGKSLRFPAGTYKAANLTSSASNQVLFADGDVLIQKNANGDLLTLSGGNVTIRGIRFVGDASNPTFTGNGVVATGNNFSMLDCASNWFSGRAVKATGGHVQIIGTKAGGIYQTTDATATGYDIEIGQSGTATLYHYLSGIYTSQSTGGILMTDVGSHQIVGGLFGKLSILSGTSPAGVNGGMTVASRILGNVTVNLSNATFSANQFSSITFTMGAGTSGISLDRSNVWASGASVVNNGNTNNLIVRDGEQGGLVSNKYGGGASLAIEAFDPSTGDIYNVNGHTRYANNRGIVLNAGNGNIVMSGGNLGVNNYLGSTQLAAAGALQFLPVGESIFYTNGVQKFAINSAGRPRFDGGTQTTVGAAGGASALPATPTGYIIIDVGGTEYVMPYYPKA